MTPLTPFASDRVEELLIELIELDCICPACRVDRYLEAVCRPPDGPPAALRKAVAAILRGRAS